MLLRDISNHFTISLIDGSPEMEMHDSLREAETFAREVSEEGMECTVVEVIQKFEAKEQPSLNDMYCVRPGRDYPESFGG